MKKTLIIAILLLFVAFPTSLFSQGQIKVRNDQYIQIGYENYNALTFGKGSGSLSEPNNGSWAIEYCSGCNPTGFNIYKPWPNPGSNAGNLSINPCLTAAQAISIIKNTADPGLYALQCNQPYLGQLGTGRLDVEKACMLAAQTAIKTFDIPTVFTNDSIVKSNYSIKNTASVTIESGANVEFKARRDIELGAGFEVKAGATFTAEIDPYLKICQ